MISNALTHLRKLNAKAEVMGMWDDALFAIAQNPSEV
jgi:hypothetical protein